VPGLGAALANHAKRLPRSDQRSNGTYQRIKVVKESTTPSGQQGLHRTGALAHPSTNKHVLPLKKQHAHGRASEPPNKYQKYFIGRLGGLLSGAIIRHTTRIISLTTALREIRTKLPRVTTEPPIKTETSPRESPTSSRALPRPRSPPLSLPRPRSWPLSPFHPNQPQADKTRAPENRRPTHAVAAEHSDGQDNDPSGATA
jgi:hypothetical protein